MNDASFALRQLARARGFTAVAVATIALGIGSSTVVFSVVNRVLIVPPPFPDPDSVVMVRETLPPRLPDSPAASARYLEWRRRASSFQDLGAAASMTYNLTGAGEPVRLGALKITASLLPTLGVVPFLGRGFAPGDERPDPLESAAILSHGLWQRAFGGRADVIGQTVRLNDRAFQVVGVMARQSPFPERAEVLTPLGFSDVQRRDLASHWLSVYARLRPGVTVEAAQGEMAAISAQPSDGQRGSWGARVVSVTESLVAGVRPVLLAVAGAVAFLLFIVCTNVAGLLLVRATHRTRELAVRAALGASRGRIVRQLLVESLLLSLLGGAAGILVARAGLSSLLALAPPGLPGAGEIAVDGRALAVASLLAVLAGLTFGILPAFQAARLAPGETLKQSARGTTADRARVSLRGALVVVQIAAALMLLAGAGLLMRSYRRQQAVSLGFDTRDVTIASVHLPRPRYGRDDQYLAFARDAVAEIARLPEVRAVAATTTVPFQEVTNGSFIRGVSVAGQSVAPGEAPLSSYSTVGPDYFRAMGIPLLRGRTFGPSDSDRSPPVAIVSASLARRFFPDGEAVGKAIVIGGGRRSREIVGVAGDVKPDKLDEERSLQVYEPFAQAPDNDIVFVVRAGATAGLAAALRAAVQRADPQQPLFDVRPLAAQVGDALARERFATILFAIFAAMALTLAGLGVYGVMAYSVGRREAEIGIRMALGAAERDIVAMVLGQAGWMVGAGLLLGLAGALALTRLLASMLFGVTSHDPLTFFTVAVLLSCVAGLACLVPARRAARVDPMTALRAE